MKAEHRKELQTNALADRMGRIIQGMKTRPKRGTVVTWLLVGLLVLVVIFFFWSRRSRSAEAARKWILLEEGDLDTVRKELALEEPLTPQGKAARFQVAWYLLWNDGIKPLVTNPGRALDRIRFAQKEYRALAEETKDDKVWGPEALYGVAVAEETLAVEVKDVGDQLKKAQNRYKDVVDQFPESARGKAAKKRLEELKDNDRLIEITEFYKDLNARLERRIQQDRQLRELQKQLQEQSEKLKKQTGQ